MKDPFENKIKATGMKVPEGYFEDFHKKMEQQLFVESTQPQIVHTPVVEMKRKPIMTPFWRRVSIAAVFVVGLFSAQLFVSDTSEPTAQNVTNSTLDDLSIEEVIATSVTEYDLYEYLYADGEY